MFETGLYPPDPSKNAMYVLGMNDSWGRPLMKTFAWDPKKKQWIFVGKSGLPESIGRSPENVASFGWQIVEETDVVIYDAYNMYGQRETKPPY